MICRLLSGAFGNSMIIFGEVIIELPNAPLRKRHSEPCRWPQEACALKQVYFVDLGNLFYTRCSAHVLLEKFKTLRTFGLPYTFSSIIIFCWTELLIVFTFTMLGFF